jgi:hypothetical protein
MPAAGMSAAVKLELRGRRHVRLAVRQKPIPVPIRRQSDAPFVSGFSGHHHEIGSKASLGQFLPLRLRRRQHHCGIRKRHRRGQLRHRDSARYAPSLEANAVAVAHDQHPHHEFGIDRRPVNSGRIAALQRTLRVGPLPDKTPAFASEYGTLDHHGRGHRGILSVRLGPSLKDHVERPRCRPSNSRKTAVANDLGELGLTRLRTQAFTYFLVQ